MRQRLLFASAILFSFSLTAGEVTIEKSDSLIRNDLFQQKRIRGEEYKQQEQQRRRDNQAWSESLAPSCVLFAAHYLIYSCVDGSFFQAEQGEDKLRYRPLSKQQVNKLLGKSE